MQFDRLASPAVGPRVLACELCGHERASDPAPELGKQHLDLTVEPVGCELIAGRLEKAAVARRPLAARALDIGGDEQRVTGVQTQVSAVTFKHILLPVWMAAYKYNGQTYRFVVNGRTGRVQGERPYSKWKIAFAVLLGLVFALTVGYFYAMNQ